jgi:hypothetical protein
VLFYEGLVKMKFVAIYPDLSIKSLTQLRQCTFYRMMAPSPRISILKNFVEWLPYDPDFATIKSPSIIPKGMHLFDWLENQHGIEAALYFGQVSPISFFENIHNMHNFGKWTAGYVKHGFHVPAEIIVFMNLVDASMVKLRYHEMVA